MVTLAPSQGCGVVVARPGEVMDMRGGLAKVARLHNRGNIQLHDQERPEPADGMSLVRVTDVGLCGSDLHWFAEGGRA